MKKAAAILLLTVYIFATTEAHQLLKLPVVFEHFAEHQQEDKNISFLEFLDMHYLHGSPVDDDYDRDMQLPFKTTDCISAVTTAYVPVTVQYSVLKPVEIPRVKIKIQSDYFTFNSYSSSIWQPPKTA